MAARTTVLLLLVLMATSALSVQTPRVKRDKGGHHHQHAPIGSAQYSQQQRPAYIPVPVPIHLQPASVILPSPPQSYQQPTVSSYQPAYQQPQQYQQASQPGPYQPPPPPPPPQQPQYQQPQYQPPPPPAPAPYQPQAQYQPPPPPPPQQPEYQQPAPEQYAPAPQQYAPQPAPQQPDYQQSAPSEQYAPAPVAQAYQSQPVAQQYAAAAPAPIEPLLPLPLYARQQLKAAAQPPTDVNYAPVQENSASYEQQDQPAQPAGYAVSEPVTVPSVSESASSYSSGSAEPVDQDLQTNAISLGAVPPPSVIPSSSSSSSANGSSQWSEGSIPWTLEKLGLNTLNDLLVLAGLDETFDKEGPFTVFVPVDQAFEILIQKFGGMEKATEEFNKNPDVLESLLKHHVVPGSIPSSALQNNAVLQSLLKTPLRVKFYESEDHEWRPLKVITVNGARVVKPDIQASNGVIHIVDRVIFPVPQADIYNTLKTDPQQRYKTLVSAIDKAGLTSVLANPTGGPFTVFAPTDKAFALSSPAELNKIFNDPARLTKLLQRHVVQDLIYTSGLQGFQKAYALDFEILYIYHGKGMTKVNGANVIDQDATTLNGVIHTIDSVLGLY